MAPKKSPPSSSVTDAKPTAVKASSPRATKPVETKIQRKVSPPKAKKSQDPRPAYRTDWHKLIVEGFEGGIMAAYVNHKSYPEHPAYTRDFEDKVRSADKTSLLTHIKLIAIRGDPEDLDQIMKFQKKDQTGHDKPWTDGHYSTNVYLRILLDEQNNTAENRLRWAQDLANIISVVCEHGPSNTKRLSWTVKVQEDRTTVPMRHIGDLITTDSAFTVLINLYETYSFEDLVKNNEAMKVVFGEKRYEHARARYEGSKKNFASEKEDKGKLVDDKIQALGINSEEL